jgi:ribosomal protein L7/L12
MTDRAERAERIQLLTEVARPMLASGADADQVAKELLRRTGSPISVIMAVADATGMGLGDAKWVVHRNLNPEVREAAEHLWDDMLDAIRQLQEPTTSQIRRVEPPPR